MIRHMSEEDIMQHLKVAEEIAARHKHYADLGEAWSTRLTILIYSGRFAESERLLQSLQQIAEETGDPQLLYLSAYRHSELETEKQNYDTAIEWIDEAEKWVRQLGSQRFLGKMLHWRGAIKARQNDFIEAEKNLLRALDLHMSWKGYRYVAYDKHRLAIVYALSGKEQSARRYAEEARNLYNRLGLAQNVGEVERLLRNLSNPSDNHFNWLVPNLIEGNRGVES